MSHSTPEIRERAVAAHQAGQTFIQIATCYGVHWKTVQKWYRKFRETGDVQPKKRGHRAPVYDAADRQRLATLVEQNNDATLEELRSHLGKKCSLVAVHNTLKALGFHLKKNASGKRTRSPGR